MHTYTCPYPHMDLTKINHSIVQKKHTRKISSKSAIVQSNLCQPLSSTYSVMHNRNSGNKLMHDMNYLV